MTNDTPPHERESEPALLLVGHGTTEPAGVAEFLVLKQQVADAWPHGPVEAGFLEFAAPTIAQAVNQLVRLGTGRFLVTPVLLFEAGHARRDIPRAVEKAVADLVDNASDEAPGLPSQKKHIAWRQTSPLESHPAVVRLSLRRYRQAISEQTFKDRENESRSQPTTTLLLVGRGSRDTYATANMREFARLRAEHTAGVDVTTCFYAMAEPSFAAALQQIVTAPPADSPRRVVVQPHLLFRGRILESIAVQIREAQQRRGDIQWLVASHLGPDRLLAQAVLDIACEKLQITNDKQSTNRNDQKREA